MKEIVSKFEKETGRVLLDSSVVPKTRKEFDELTSDMSTWRGVMYEDRIKFLKDNGYKLTRKNLIDIDLSAKPQEEDVDGRN